MSTVVSCEVASERGGELWYCKYGYMVEVRRKESSGEYCSKTISKLKTPPFILRDDQGDPFIRSLGVIARLDEGEMWRNPMWRVKVSEVKSQ